jgi:probable F420-dependent oxidoreductase
MDLKAPLPDLGRIGVFSWGVVTQPSEEVRAAVRTIEDLGFGTIWFPESYGREAFTAASLVLEATERIVVATGIANIWARDPTAAALGAYGLADAHPGRFVLGLGVSHAPSVKGRGHTYSKPLRRMQEYLDVLETVTNPLPGGAGPPVVLAALGPLMLDLAAERTSGAHPYFVPVAHTSAARARVGQGPTIAPEQAIVIGADPTTARAAARAHMERYLLLDNYRNNLLRLGWSEDDVAGGGSDDLVDAVVGWGDPEAVATRVTDHLDAGADHVAVQPLGDPWGLDQLEALARLLI